MSQTTLHIMCGKMAAGKSTLAAKLARRYGAILLAEDQWTSTLWPGELVSLDDYVDRSRRLKRVLFPHLAHVLDAGVSIVLDFPGNTVAQRARFKQLIDASTTAHILHFLDVPDDVCRQRLKARNADGNHPFAPSEEDFDRFTAHFVPPSPQEGFFIRRWDARSVESF